MSEVIVERAGVLATIGNTPVVRLERLVEPGMAEVWVKLESENPTGSYKDRMALAMIEGGERSGRLRPGQTVVEYTGGSTGSSLAFVCSLKGYPLRVVTSDAFAAEKLRTMDALGAALEVVPSPEGITPQLIPRLMERSAEIVEETGGFATDQFRNADMLETTAWASTAAASSARRESFDERYPTCFVSRSSRRSRRFCPGAARARIASREAGAASGRLCSSAPTSTRS